MDKKQVMLLPLLFLFPFLLMITAGCMMYSVEPRMFHSDFTYDMSIASDRPIKNATFIIPLPVNHNKPMIGLSTLTADEFHKGNEKTEITQLPQGLNLTNAVVWEGYTPWYVIIRSNELEPETDNIWNYHFHKQVSIDPESSEYSEYTLYPKGNESVIMPKMNFSWHDPQQSEVWPRNVKYHHPPVIQETWVYADYSAISDTKTQILFQIKDEHYWKQEYDAWMGNQFSDQFALTIIGEAKGWYLARGTFSAAQGTYPNYNNPDWQKALNRTGNAQAPLK